MSLCLSVSLSVCPSFVEKKIWKFWVRIGINKRYNAVNKENVAFNDFFTLYGNVAAESILEFRVFNRWGAQVYEGRNITPGDEPAGWDGLFKGEMSQTGVYAYYAIVRFIDGVEILYEGDITLFR